MGARVLRGHSLKGRAQTSALATPRSDQPEQTGSGGRTSFQALGGIPAPRPFVRPPAGPMLSTGGQYAVKKRGKAVPKRLDAEACWERTPYRVRTPAGVRLALTDPEGSPPGPAGVAEGRF
ncbi:hypothetical protein R6Z07M_001924 [Ovis aries]